MGFLGTLLEVIKYGMSEMKLGLGMIKDSMSHKGSGDETDKTKQDKDRE